MTTTIKFDDSEVRKALKALMKECQNPSKELLKVGQAIIVPAVKKNFDTHGTYFSDPWPPISDFMITIRNWQGWNKYQSQGPLQATGQLKKSWAAVMDGKTKCIVGSTLAHAEDLQQGKEGTGVFRKKGGGGSVWMHTFRNVREFHILPSSGKLPGEVNKDIVKKLMRRLEEVVSRSK